MFEKNQAKIETQAQMQERKNKNLFAISDLSRGHFAFQYGFEKAEGCRPLLAA